MNVFARSCGSLILRHFLQCMIHLTEWGGFFQTNIMKNNNKDNKDKDSTTTQPTSITQSKCVIHFSSTTQTVDLTKQSSAFIPSLRRVIRFLGQLLVTDPQVDNFPIWWLSEGIPLPISGGVLSIFNWSLVKELFPNFTKPKTKSLISRSGIVEIVLPTFLVDRRCRHIRNQQIPFIGLVKVMRLSWVFDLESNGWLPFPNNFKGNLDSSTPHDYFAGKDLDDLRWTLHHWCWRLCSVPWSHL